MKLKKSNIEEIAQKLYRDFQGKSFLHIHASQTNFITAVSETIQKNMDEEMKLEESVKKVLEPYEPQFRAGELDYHKMFELTKKQLAKEKGIIL